MRTAHVQVFQYDELSDAAKAKARDWWRGLDRDHSEWSEHVTEDLKTIAAFMGWTVSDTQFRGFSSQGDGAQFSGTWSAANVQTREALEEHAPADASDSNARLARMMLTFAELAAQSPPGATASVRHEGAIYVHEHMTRFESDNMSDEQLAKLTEVSRELMRWYYRALEREHDYYTSDEQVAEAICANEYEFKADGSRFAH